MTTGPQEKLLDLIRARIERMTAQEALHWFGAFTGALCSALDNPHKWNICLTAADMAVKIPGVRPVKTKEVTQ